MLATKTVYSLYYPETRRIVDALWSEKPHHLYERNYTKRQDGMHQPFLDGWRRFARNAGVVFSEEFHSAYPIAGANEGLQALVASCAARPSSERPRLHLFAGEYEGFQYLAAAAFLEVVVHSREPELYRASFAREARRGDWLFVSQPSAVDGNVWLGFAELVRFLEAHVPEISLCMELTYVGAVAKGYSI